jgi:hypothetical protein
MESMIDPTPVLIRSKVLANRLIIALGRGFPTKAAIYHLGSGKSIWLPLFIIRIFIMAPQQTLIGSLSIYFEPNVEQIKTHPNVSQLAGH